MSSDARICRRAAPVAGWRAAFAIGARAAAALTLVAALIFTLSRPPLALLAEESAPVPEGQEEKSRAAFLAAYKVFMHPRCLNCHPVGGAPLQGDESLPHGQNVQRGALGRGLYAQKCTNCHQATNLPGANMPPGVKSWHMPTAKTPIVFEGLSARELADQMKDKSKNGDMTLDELMKHVEADPLVLWGWSPGDGRTLPPLTHAEFVAKMREWIDTGAVSPQ